MICCECPTCALMVTLSLSRTVCLQHGMRMAGSAGRVDRTRTQLVREIDGLLNSIAI